ncbi:MAG: AmmeMemoRadiSam system protein B [Candidatus Magasanikbacteria bacterium]
MSLVFSAITPNTPLLLKNVAQEDSEKLEQTRTALEEIEKKIYLSKPETIIVVSSSDQDDRDRFYYNVEPSFESDFTEFGDVSTSMNWNCDNVLAAEIEQNIEKIPFEPMSRKKLNKDISVPLHFLTTNMEQIKILPIRTCNLSKNPHLKLGKKLQDVIEKKNKRVAVIASGSLSHSLTEESPADFHEDGAVFDSRIKKFLEQKDRESILKMDESTIENANEYLYKPLLVLLGILSGKDFSYQETSYQQSFGIGHLVANLELP